jgi:DNA uptake protein ComE-like DNA-binding protein
MGRRDGWKDWFYFTTRQRSGLLVLSAVCLVLVAARLFLSGNPSDGEAQGPERHRELLAMLAELKKRERQPQPAARDKEQPAPRASAPCFAFDPNVIDRNQWMSLGFSEAQASSILRYRASGAVFRVKADLKKLFVVSEEKYRWLADCIQLPDSLQPAPIKPRAAAVESRPLVLDLNAADTAALMQLRGIGPYFARKIVRYRDALGGYCEVRQLSEVYRMRPGLLDSIAPFLTADPVAVQKMSVNQAEVALLEAHPYLSRSQAEVMVAYREKHGPYRKKEDLKKMMLLTDEEIERLLPYLSFD